MNNNHTNVTVWSDSLRILLIGNSIINNLAEPDVQVDELLQRIIDIKKMMAEASLSACQKELLLNEIERQLSYMMPLHQKLGDVIRQYTDMVKGGPRHD